MPFDQNAGGTTPSTSIQKVAHDKKNEKLPNGNGNSLTDGHTFVLQNPYIGMQDLDHLYHLSFNSKDDLEKKFGDVKFVCMGGKASRMKSAILDIIQEINCSLPFGSTLENISEKSQRYSMYKVGPILCVNHGMGEPSISILLHELIKLLYYSKVKDPIFFRIGTSGGLGIEPGTVVVAKKAFNGYLEENYTLPVLGKPLKRPTVMDTELAEDLVNVAKELNYSVVLGGTMSTMDFYEGQGRLDGAFCEYSEDEKIAFLKEAYSKGVRNIEMEAAAFSAITFKAGIKSALVNVTLLDRLKEDQLTTKQEQLSEWELYPQKIVARYIKNYLNVNINSK